MTIVMPDNKTSKYRRLPAVMTPEEAADFVLLCDGENELRKHDLVRLYQAMGGTKAFAPVFDIPKQRLWSRVQGRAFAVLKEIEEKADDTNAGDTNHGTVSDRG